MRRASPSTRETGGLTFPRLHLARSCTGSMTGAASATSQAAARERDRDQRRDLERGRVGETAFS